jgi:putative endonuclease
VRPGDWWVYILELENGAWYTGISTDPRARFEKHKTGKGAKSMRLSAPFRLVSLEFLGPYATALRREAQIKGLNRSAKEAYAKDCGSLAWPSAGAVIRRKSPVKRKKRSAPL